jgi:hypothetical protein
MDDTAMIWFALRERRASLEARSRLGESAGRRQTFAAAMAQFEEQMTAAKVVSPATRPLNLYYGLAQAGMAIAAARAPDPWSFSSHGLKLVDTAPQVSDIQVRTEGTGAFQKVAAATGSPGITSPVSLGALWASLPDLGRDAPLPGGRLQTALDLVPRDFPDKGPRAEIYLPSSLLSRDETDLAKLAERFGEIMADYPGARDYIGIPAETGAVEAPENSQGQWSVMVEWRRPDLPQSWSNGGAEAFFDSIAPEYLYRGDRFLRPSVERDGSLPPSPLMTWWLLLFSFSILARYQPRKWMQLLDLDKPGCAVLLQFALEAALSAVPHLVLEALDGESFLLSKPFSF